MSLLDTDFYKFTMQQIVLHRFADAQVEYQFICRTPGIDFSGCFATIQEKIDVLCQQQLSADELAYLQSLNVFKQDYLDYLKDFRLQRDKIIMSCDDGFSLHIRGSWLDTILFETPLLSIINEAYFAAQYPRLTKKIGRERLQQKIALLKNEMQADQLKFVDFGSRRRFSFAWQQEVLQTLQQHCASYLIGTSNVYYAKQLGLQPIGTMAHEYIQAMQALAPDLRDSQRFAFKEWLHEYGDKLAIALTDTYNTDVFLQDFDLQLSQAYQGVRQDSGDPFAFAKRYIAHLQKLGIDPLTKQLIFSDSLTFAKMIELQKAFAGKINIAFGIGTNLMNDMGVDTLNIVIKMIRCNQQSVAKISNNPVKIASGDAAYIELLKQTFAIQKDF